MSEREHDPVEPEKCETPGCIYAKGHFGGPCRNSKGRRINGD